MEGRGFRDKLQEYKAKGATILGISFDSVEANRAFAEKFTFPYPLLCDTDRTVGLAYGACDSPTAGTARRITYLIDPEGVIQGAWGQSSKIDVTKHPDEVLSAIG